MTSNLLRETVCSAFSNIADKNGLAWSILDTKSEAAVVRALALQINRDGRLRARTEYPPRVDLALVSEGHAVGIFEAKAAYVTDFQPRRVARRDWYLGGCVDEDIAKLNAVTPSFPKLAYRAALFFLYEVSDPSKQLKYGRNPPVEHASAERALIEGVRQGRLAANNRIDCGRADDADVAVHLYLFEPGEAGRA